MQLSIKQVSEVYKNAQNVIEAEQRKQFILTQGVREFFMEQLATGFSNYFTEEIIFFSIHVPAAIVSQTHCAGNVNIVRFLSTPTKSLNACFKTFPLLAHQQQIYNLPVEIKSFSKCNWQIPGSISLLSQKTLKLQNEPGQCGAHCLQLRSLQLFLSNSVGR